jgi:hypothetical protein
MSPLGQAAMALAHRGLRIFPIVERSKEPLIKDNLKRATTDSVTIRQWWRWRDHNIGVATGPDFGIWVLDVDGIDGEGTLRQLEAEHGALPATVESITGDGRHLYWRWPRGVDIRNASTATSYAVTSIRLSPCTFCICSTPSATSRPSDTLRFDASATTSPAARPIAGSAADEERAGGHRAPERDAR